MNVLIIYAHPNPQSFNHAVLETAVSTLQKNGHTIEVRDLYVMGFDPVLKADDFAALRAGRTPADVQKEQESIRAADLLVVIHPIWWTGLPAMIKGYFDRVFTHGFAYAIENGAVIGRLKGKKVVVFNTQGTPGEVYEASGMFKSLHQTSDDGIYRFCGLEVAAHPIFPAVPYVDEATRRGYLDEVRRILTALS